MRRKLEGVEENGLGEEEAGVGELDGGPVALSGVGEGEVAVCIGQRIEQVQELWGRRFGVPEDELKGVFDKLWKDDDEFAVGELTCKVVHLPGQ